VGGKPPRSLFSPLLGHGTPSSPSGAYAAACGHDQTVGVGVDCVVGRKRRSALVEVRAARSPPFLRCMDRSSARLAVDCGSRRCSLSRKAAVNEDTWLGCYRFSPIGVVSRNGDRASAVDVCSGDYRTKGDGSIRRQKRGSSGSRGPLSGDPVAGSAPLVLGGWGSGDFVRRAAVMSAAAARTVPIIGALKPSSLSTGCAPAAARRTRQVRGGCRRRRGAAATWSLSQNEPRLH